MVQNKDKAIEVFKAFMGEKDYKAFCTEFMRLRGKCTGETVEQFLQETNVGHFISGSFTWADSRRGHMFWEALYERWSIIASVL